jgi:hypothetical protein
MSVASPSLSPAPIAKRPISAKRFWLLLAGAIFLLKLLLLALDHAPMFYLGDSMAYLNTAKWNWIPPDRSFLYGYVILEIAFKRGSLLPLLAAQALASAVAALLVALILRRAFAAPRPVAAGIAVLCALEPLQLLYERYVMTEAFSLLMFAAFVTACLAYLRRATAGRLLLAQVAGVLVICFRVSFLPMIEAATILLPLLAWASPPAPPASAASPSRPWSPLLRRRWFRPAAHLILSLVLFTTLHGAYKRYYAALIQHQLPGAPPAYYYDNGFHLLCFVAPIVEPRDFPHPEKAEEIFRVAWDLKVPRLRDRQRWLEGGLIANVKAAYPDHLEANRLSEITAWNAVKRDPLGELRLAWWGFREYFNRESLRAGMLSDRGADRPLLDELLADLRSDYGIEDGSRLPYIPTPTNRYYFAAWPWYLALLLLPIPAFALIWLVPRPQRPGAGLLWIFASLQIAIVAAFSIGPTVRFLHAVAWLAMLAAGIALTRTLARPVPPAAPQDRP